MGSTVFRSAVGLPSVVVDEQAAFDASCLLLPGLGATKGATDSQNVYLRSWKIKFSAPGAPNSLLSIAGEGFKPNESLQLDEQFLHDVSCDIREAEVAALMAIGESSVIESQAMHDCGLQIVDVDSVFHRVVA